MQQMPGVRSDQPSPCRGTPLSFLSMAILAVGCRYPGSIPHRSRAAKVVAVDYFTKWIEAEVVAPISTEKVHRFYWKNIICRFGFPKVIVTDNGIQFASASVVDFCKGLGFQNRFTSVEHPQANKQAEAANKIILTGLKKKLEHAKGLWAEYLHEILWSYHTTPHPTTQETPFRLVYGADTIIPIEINTPTWRRAHFNEDANLEGLNVSTDLVNEVRESTRIREYAAKDRFAIRYSLKFK
ncbi:uncharacterized protein LOC131649458 [Vicia villosa]|uniref:uncharacterized protein LOC131649458 n=1 Tax=Vicia villosa TaxID=3911 RepID=UPI00273BE8D6|nr:uncharacterized protein LOC131649458 [Vicia villosa]